MDNIDRIMKEADRLGFGVSYGKYRAAYPNGSGGVISSAPKPKPPEKPSGTCKLCGKLFVKSHANNLYCSAECKAEAEKKRQRDWYRKKIDLPAVAVCVICGADFKPKNFRNKCCSRECSEENRRNASRRWYAAHKRRPDHGLSL